MAIKGTSFVTQLKKAHLEWGTHRYTSSRGFVYGEGYLQIPSNVADNYNITNNKNQSQSAVYKFSTSDNFYIDEELLASGNQSEKEFAKQFQGNGDLKLLGAWFAHVNAEEGDEVLVEFIEQNEILLTFIKKN